MFNVFGEKQNPVDQALDIIEKEQKVLNKINQKISKNKINGKNIANFIAKYEEILKKIESVQSVIYFSPANQQGENYKRLYKAYIHYYETLEDLAENNEVKRHELSNTIEKIVGLCRTMLDVSSSPLHDMSPISSSSSRTSPILTQVEPIALSPPLIRGSIERSREARRIKIEMNGQTELQKSLLVIEKDLTQLQEEISKLKQEKRLIENDCNHFKLKSDKEIENIFNNIIKFYPEIKLDKEELMLCINRNNLKKLKQIKENLIEQLKSNYTIEAANKKKEGLPNSKLPALERDLAHVQGLLEERIKFSNLLNFNQIKINEKRSICIERIKNEHKKFNISDNELNDLQSIDENNFVIFKEILFNRITNRVCFEKQIQTFVELNKVRIIKEMTGKEDLSSKDIKFSMKLLEAEGHNGGKRPVHITLQLEDNSLEFICKPRDATIDQKVIETFAEMNKANRKLEEPLLTILPNYKIIQPQKEQGWQGLELIGTISIWEYIKGKNVKELTKTVLNLDGVSNVYQFAVGKDHEVAKSRKKKIVQNLEKEKEKEVKRDLNVTEKKEIAELAARIEEKIVERLVKQVVDMDAIFTEMHITDQHTENVLYVEDNLDQILSPHDVEQGKGVFALIPIDLENRQLGPSQLGTPDKFLKPVSQKIQKNQDLFTHIETFNESCSHQIKRYVLITTKDLARSLWYGWQDPSRLEDLVNRLPSQLISSVKGNFTEYKLIGNESEFHEKVTKAYLEDILNYDIPYFTEKEGIIYYGLPERKIALFERQ